MTHAAGSAPAHDVQRIAEAAAELTARRMMDELRKEFRPFTESVSAMKPIVLGNGVKPLAEIIGEVAKACAAEHQRLHDRISDEKNSGRSFRNRARGWYEALASAGGLIAFLFLVVKFMKGGSL